MHTSLWSLRYGIRRLRCRPSATAAMVATLMIGIGATTAIYTVVYTVPDRSFAVSERQTARGCLVHVNGYRNGVSASDFLDWQQQSKSFQQVTAWTGASFNVATQDQPRQLIGRRTTPVHFDMQGIPMFLGRDFLPEDGVPGKDQVVILTYKLWDELGADRSIVGHTMQVDGKPYWVVGVLSPGLADRLGFDMAAPLAFTPPADQLPLSLDLSHGTSEARRHLRTLPPRIPNPTRDGVPWLSRSRMTSFLPSASTTCGF